MKKLLFLLMFLLACSEVFAFSFISKKSLKGATSDSSGNVTLEGSLSVGGSNQRLTFTTSAEYIDGSTDGYILMQGAGGTDNTDLRIDLDGTRPIIDSVTDDAIGFADDIFLDGTQSMLEQASANADVAGYGQYWVKTATPNLPYFTNDAGTDIRVDVGSVFCVEAINNATSTAKCSLSQCSTSDAQQDRLTPITSDGVFSNLYAAVIGAPDNGVGTQAWDFTLRVNDSATTLTCDIEETATTCNDTTNTVTVSAGDLVGFNITPSGTPASGTSEAACFQFTAS